MTPREKKLTLLFLAAATAIGLVNVFLIPPFMNPDEIQHFMYAADVAHGKKAMEETDRRVLQLLKEHRWFHLIGVGPGWQSVRKISDIYFINRFRSDQRSVSRSQFHYLYGKILGLAGVRDPLPAFYLLRLVSCLLYIITFWICLSFYRARFPDYWPFMAMGHLFILQLAGVSSAVNYDVLLTLLGALFFIRAYVFMETGEKRQILFMLVLAALSSLVKTGGLLFFVYCFIAVLFRYPLNRRMLGRLGFSALLFAAVFSWFNYWFPERFFNLYTALFAKIRGLAAIFAGESGDVWSPAFFNSILDSFYFYTGWMGFKLGEGWYIALKLLLLAALAGAFLIIFRDRGGDAFMGRERRWLVFSLAVLVFQVLSIRFYYHSGVMAQGRYLYPLLIPVIILVLTGLGAWERKWSMNREYLTIAWLLFQALFFFFGLVRMLSVFYLEVASPHAGL